MITEIENYSSGYGNTDALLRFAHEQARVLAHCPGGPSPLSKRAVKVARLALVGIISTTAHTNRRILMDMAANALVIARATATPLNRSQVDNTNLGYSETWGSGSWQTIANAQLDSIVEACTSAISE